MRPISGVLSTVLVAVVLALGGPSPGPAGAAAFGILPHELADLLVDEAHGRVFVSGGAVVTTDLVGTKTGAVAGISGARQMTLTPDGAQLVVARADGLAVVDPDTATLVRTIPTGAGSCPESVTPAAGLIFFSYGACDGGTPGLGAVDLADDTVTTGIDTGTLVLSPAEFSEIPVMLRSVPAAPSTVLVAAGNTVAVLEVTGGEAPAVAVQASKAFTNIPKDVVLNPAGTEVVAVGEGKGVSAFSTTDLAHLRSYGATTTYASDFRADGRLAVNLSGERLGLYAPGSTAQIPVSIGYRLDIGDRAIDYGAVHLYAVVRSLDTGGLSVRIAPARATAKITITTDHSIYRYKNYAVVTIAVPTPTQNLGVRLYSRSSSGKKLLRTGNLSPTSRKIQFKVQVTKNTQFRAEYPGDEIYLPAAAERGVKVRSKVVLSSSSTSLSGSYHRLKGSPAPLVSGTVYPASPNVCVQVSGQILVDGRWASIGQNSCLRTTSTSRFGLKLIGFAPGDRIRVFARAKENTTNVESPYAVYYVLIT